METISLKLTVLFEPPFWVGIFERQQGKKVEIAKIIFVKEPKINDICEFVLTQYQQITFSPEIDNEIICTKKINPKRMQRLVKKQVSSEGIGTKSQQALKMQHEIRKVASRKKKRENKALERQKRFEIKQKKRYEKHKGH